MENIERIEAALEAVLALQEKGYACYAIEQVDNSIMLQDMVLGDKPIALVFGNEVEGVDAEVLPLMQGSIEIPQWGMKHSLNVSVATGIVLWEMVRKQMKL